MRPVIVVGWIAVLAVSVGCQAGPVPTPQGSASASSIATGGDARNADVTLKVGEHTRLSLGQYNASVGDSWSVLSYTATHVAGVEILTAGLQINPPPGSPSNYYADVTALAPGKTTVALRYCYRSAPAPDCDQGPRTGADYANVVFTVRVS